MNIRNLLLSAGLLLSVLTASSQGVSTQYQPGITQDAVSYWLPKTQFTITVTAQKQTFKPGEFSRYAERYLRLTDIKDKAQEVWEITDVKISAAGIPDQDKLYTLAFPAKGNRPYIELTDEGIISAVNVHLPEPEIDESPAPAIAKEKRINPQDFMTEEILMAGSTAKMAELTAKEIYNIRESRNAITRGQSDFVPKDGESLKYMLESLSAQEAALLTLFSGTSETEDVIFTINVTPDAAVNKQILFRFSTKLGLLPVDNLAGEPVWIDITDKKMLPEQNNNPKSKNNKKGTGPCLYYRIPGKATVKVYNNRISFIEKDFQVAQFGNVEVVSSTIMGKNADTKILFDTTTGNIKSINE